MDYFHSGNRSQSSSYGGSPIDHEDEDEYPEDYVPLSNLPTPPLSFAASTPPEYEFTDVDPEVLAPAIHLCKLIPSDASRLTLSPGQVAEYLTRTRLSFQTLAFAACVLDSLSPQFVRSWRNALIEAHAQEDSAVAAAASTSSKSPSLVRQHSRLSRGSITYNWKPELIVLAALQVASSFLDDTRSNPKFWAEKIALGRVSSPEVDATVRAVLKDIDYDLCSFQSDDVEHMQRAMMRGMKHIDSLREQKSLQQPEQTLEIVS